MKAVTEGLLANTSVGDLSRYQTDEYHMVSNEAPRKSVDHMHPLAGQVGT